MQIGVNRAPFSISPMSKKPSPLKPRTAKSERGFALVLALSLMSLVFLLVVSLVSLVGTDLNLTELRKQKVLAQANAKMGMMIAIGEIQKHLGPDTRVSATADILDERVESSDVYLNQNYSSRVTPTDGIDLNEDNQFNKNQLEFETIHKKKTLRFILISFKNRSKIQEKT